MPFIQIPALKKKVAELFEREHIEYFLPLIKKYKVWSDRRKIIEVPLFNSYIFVFISEHEHLSVLKIPGVVRFITFEGLKVSIRPVQIEAIKKYLDTGEEWLENEADYVVGKRVKVNRGSMKGLEGRLVQILGKQRVKVEIDAIQQSVFVKIPKGSLDIIP
jgi:transcriptional antiterminator RfaH